MTCRRISALVIGISLALSCVPGHAAQATQTDSFTPAHAKAVAANPAGVEIHLSFEGGRTSFHMGEPVPVTFSSTGSKPGTIQIVNENTIYPDSFLVDPVRGVSVPDADKFTLAPTSLLPGAPPHPVLNGDVFQSTQMLNPHFRFDMPGHYRIYAKYLGVQTTTSIDTGHPSMLLDAVSDIIAFDILPKDASWERSQLNSIKKRLASSDFNVNSNAQRDLNFLGTNDAVTEMLRLLQGSPEDPEPLIDGLYAARDRHFVVASLKKALTDPDFAVSPEVVNALARLDFTMRHPIAPWPPGKPMIATAQSVERESAILREQPLLVTGYYRTLLGSLGVKQGRARAVSLVTLMTNSDLVPSTDIVQWRRMGGMLKPSLPLLTVHEQTEVLSGPCWPLLKQTDIAPYLKSASKLIGIEDDDSSELRAVAIKRLQELKPAIRRSAISRRQIK